MKRIEEIIELIEITGDKCIILHNQTDAYVLMKLDDYRDLYKNRLEYTENKENHNNNILAKPLNIKQNQQKEQLTRLIPQKSANVSDFELEKQVMPINEEDIYYTEPLIE